MRLSTMRLMASGTFSQEIEPTYTSLRENHFFLLKPAEAENLDYAGGDFMHTNNFVLIDSKRRIRGYYDGTNPDEVDELIADIRILQSE